MNRETGDVRVSDEERRQVADRLARAQAEGRLDLGEFEERVRAAHGATLRSELGPLTADLPDPVRRDVGPSRERRAPDHGLRPAVAVWAVVSAINVVIWAIVSVAAAGPVPPWWIWVAGPWGAVLAVRAVAGRFVSAPPVPSALPAGFGRGGVPSMCGGRSRR